MKIPDIKLDDIAKMEAGPEIDRLVAVRLMGRGESVYGSCPLFSTDIAAATAMEEVIGHSEEPVKHAYAMLLSLAVWGDRGWDDWNDTWSLIRATPLQRCRAAIISVVSTLIEEIAP